MTSLILRRAGELWKQGHPLFLALLEARREYGIEGGFDDSLESRLLWFGFAECAYDIGSGEPFDVAASMAMSEEAAHG